MLRTDVALLKPSIEQEQELRRLAQHSALLWNQANYERRQAYFKRQKVPTYVDQCKSLKYTAHFKTIGTGKGQALLKKLQESWNAFFALKRMQSQGKLPSHIRKIRPPKYWKDRKTGQTEIRMFCIRNDSYRIDRQKSAILLSKELNVQYATDRMRNGKQGRLDIIYNRLSNRWYAHVPVEFAPERASHSTVKKYGSVDLGICNLVTLYAEGERPVIYSGRAVLSDWIYHTKKIAELQSKLPEKQYTSRQIQRLFRTRQRRFRHAISSMLRDLFGRLRKLGVTHFVVGDMKGIREGNDLGSRTNQKLHNFWSYNVMQKRLKDLGEEYGIQIVEQPERNTSKTCCMCGQQHNGRVHRGLHVCQKHGTAINADVNGACNILKVAVNGSLERETSSSRAMASPLMLRWEYHQWRQEPLSLLSGEGVKGNQLCADSLSRH